MEKEANYKVDTKTELIIKLLITLSCPMLTIIWATRFYITGALIGAIASLAVVILVLFDEKTRITSINKKNCIIAGVISFYMMKAFLSLYNYTFFILSTCFEINMDIIKALFGILSMPALISLVYIFLEFIIPKTKEFLDSLTKVEIKYIKIIFIIATVLTFFTIHTTTAFSKPNKLDLIYTSDSADLLYKDVYFNVSHNENDIRQPLFGFFALPFGLLAKVISEFVFFVPNDYAYEAVMTVLQFIITTITTILIARLLKLEEKDKKYLYMLFSLSFPYLIFNLVLEQYVIALFYLILTIYMFHNYQGINYTYIAATGSLITTGIVFPLITKFKNLKQYVKDIGKCLLVFICIFIISGQFIQIVTLNQTMTSLFEFAKPLPLTEKLCQFFNFVQGIFFSCKGEIVSERYWMQQVDTVSVVGVILLTIMIVSAILNRKESFARLSGLWVIFSILILVIIGWGTTENGLILYSLYFAWAYLSLYYLFLKKLCRNRKIFITLLITTIVVMAILNLKELFNIMMFAIKYY